MRGSAASMAAPLLLRIRTNCVFLGSWEQDETNLTR